MDYLTVGDSGGYCSTRFFARFYPGFFGAFLFSRLFFFNFYFISILFIFSFAWMKRNPGFHSFFPSARQNESSLFLRGLHHTMD